MEPLSTEEKKRILRNSPDASLKDIEEYERLLSQLFATDPALKTKTGAAAKERDARMASIENLYRKLYGKEPGQPPDY
jgi:hypothetical protein